MITPESKPQHPSANFFVEGGCVGISNFSSVYLLFKEEKTRGGGQTA